METIKYEPVFGDQSLFDSAPFDCEMIYADPDSDRVVFYKIIDRDVWFKFELNQNYEKLKNLKYPSNEIMAMRRIIKTPVQHSDDVAVDLFAAKMKEKLEKSRYKGRSGWESCPIEHLIDSLKDHISKGDPVDVANFAMMISQRGESIKTPVWTVADQKAGRLPEVGAKYFDKNKRVCEFLFSDAEGDLWGRTDKNMASCTSLQLAFPIETPEEKAQRERNEWAKKASEFIDDELDCVNLVGEHVMRRFYNALLSGELQAPKDLK